MNETLFTWGRKKIMIEKLRIKNHEESESCVYRNVHVILRLLFTLQRTNCFRKSKKKKKRIHF